MNTYDMANLEEKIVGLLQIMCDTAHRGGACLRLEIRIVQ